MYFNQGFIMTIYKINFTTSYDNDDQIVIFKIVLFQTLNWAINSIYFIN